MIDNTSCHNTSCHNTKKEFDTNLGSTMQISIFACKGIMNKELCDEVSNHIIKTIGMHPADYQSACWKYPLGEDQLGGSGMTIVHPLTESFAIFDTYDPLDGGYYFLASCKSFDSKKVEDLLSEHFTIVDKKEVSVSLMM